MVRSRNLKPAIPYCAMYGSDSFTVTTTPQVLTLNHSCYVTTHFRVDVGNGRITLRRGRSSGIFRWFVSISAIKATGNPSYIGLQAFKNGVACPCGISYGFIGAGVDNSTAFLHGCTDMIPGDYLEFKVVVDDGTATIVDDTCRVLVEGIPMHGWDNKRGGNERTMTEKGI